VTTTFFLINALFTYLCMYPAINRNALTRVGELLGISILALVLLRLSAVLMASVPLPEQFATPIETAVTTFLVLGGVGTVYIIGRHRETVTTYLPFEKLTTTQLFLLWKLLLLT